MDDANFFKKIARNEIGPLQEGMNLWSANIPNGLELEESTNM